MALHAQVGLEHIVYREADRCGGHGLDVVERHTPEAAGEREDPITITSIYLNESHDRLPKGEVVSLT